MLIAVYRCLRNIGGYNIGVFQEGLNIWSKGVPDASQCNLVAPKRPEGSPRSHEAYKENLQVSKEPSI